VADVGSGRGPRCGARRRPLFDYLAGTHERAKYGCPGHPGYTRRPASFRSTGPNRLVIGGRFLDLVVQCMSLEVAVRFVFAIGPMSASDGNGRCDWIDFRDALELAAKPKLDRSITFWAGQTAI
jgi:hypothetical protein